MLSYCFVYLSHCFVYLPYYFVYTCLIVFIPVSLYTWVTARLLTFWRTQNYFTPTGNQTPDHALHSLCSVETTAFKVRETQGFKFVEGLLSILLFSVFFFLLSSTSFSLCLICPLFPPTTHQLDTHITCL
jgi:hypothetical protein